MVGYGEDESGRRDPDGLFLALLRLPWRAVPGRSRWHRPMLRPASPRPPLPCPSGAVLPLARGHEAADMLVEVEAEVAVEHLTSTSPLIGET